MGRAGPGRGESRRQRWAGQGRVGRSCPLSQRSSLRQAIRSLLPKIGLALVPLALASPRPPSFGGVSCPSPPAPPGVLVWAKRASRREEPS